MNQKLRFLMLALLCAVLNVAWGQTTTTETDVLTAADFAATNNNDGYKDFSGVQKNTAIYAGNTAIDGSGNIQMRSKNSNSGIVSTNSGGKLKSVKITVGSGSNQIDVYGSNTAYTAASNLYATGSNNNQGTKIGSLTETGTITVNDEYRFVGIRSYSGAIYISSIEIEWESSDSPLPPTINADNIEIAYDATSGEIAYTIENPVEGKTLTASKTAEWISNLAVNSDDNKVTFTATANEGEADRTATITLAYEGATSKTVTVTQKHYIDPNGPGTENNPYTVAQAIEFIETLGTASSDIVYVKGIISQVDSYNSTYKSITYWISDDGTTTGQMEVYSGKGLDDANFSEKDDLLVGDEVTVKGNVKNYKGTPEFDVSSIITSFNRPATPPTFSPAAGEVKVGSKVTIVSPDDVDEVEYSYDQESWTAYTNPIEITEATTIYARSKKGDKYSAVVSASYTIKEEQKVVIIEPNKITFDLTVNEWGFPEGSTNIEVAEGQFTANGKTLTVAGGSGTKVGYYFNVQGNYLLMGKIDAYLTLPAFDFDVSKIDVVGASGASGSVIQNIFVGENAVSTNTTGAKTTNSYEINTNYQAAGTIYTLKVTNAYNTQITKIIVYKKDEPFTLTISDKATDGKNNYYATVSNLGNGSFVVPEGLEVSAITIVDRKINKTKTWAKDDVIPGDKAYYVVANSSRDFIFEPATGESSFTEDNWLYPAIANETITAPSEGNYLYYKLTLDANNSEGSVGFYFGEANGGPFAFKGDHKAYLAVPQEGGNAGLSSIAIGDFTGISEIQTSKELTDEVYTISGVRVKGNLPKGIYIVNGKKQIVK